MGRGGEDGKGVGDGGMRIVLDLSLSSFLSSLDRVLREARTD